MTCLGPDLSVRRRRWRRLEYCWATFTFGVWAGRGGGRRGRLVGEGPELVTLTVPGIGTGGPASLEEEWPSSDRTDDLGNHRLGVDVDMVAGRRHNSVGNQDLSSDGV